MNKSADTSRPEGWISLLPSSCSYALGLQIAACLEIFTISHHLHLNNVMLSDLVYVTSKAILSITMTALR